MLVALAMFLGASVGRAIALTAASSSAVPPKVATPAIAPKTTRPARVLLIGDSILDQQGSAAAFVLRQAGVDARAVGVWGSGLLTVDQYDDGKTKLSGFWLHKATKLISNFDPDVVGVYLNHNYLAPFPHDAAGHVITDLWSPAGQLMIAQQARALITILRARRAKVFFISPVPAGAISNPDPNVWDPIWHGYLPVLRSMHVAVADTAGPLEAANGLRAETKPSCTGTPQRIRLAGNVHLTRFGAGLAGTALADYVASVVHANLRGNVAPGDTTAALVSTADGRGYWLVGCDGSVYHFGDATHLAGARVAIAGHHGVVAAVSTPTGAGLWLIAADGTIATVGDASPMSFTSRSSAPIVDATALPDGNGLLATTASGIVLHAGAARPYGELSHDGLHAEVVAISATRDGYRLVEIDGSVVVFDKGHRYTSAAPLKTLNGAIVALAATRDNRGYWLVGSDGGVFTFGDARFDGTGTWHPPAYPYSAVIATPGPTIGIVATPGPEQGYWIFGTTGRVTARGAASYYGGDNNLALFTQ